VVGVLGRREVDGLVHGVLADARNAGMLHPLLEGRYIDVRHRPGNPRRIAAGDDSARDRRQENGRLQHLVVAEAARQFGRLPQRHHGVREVRKDGSSNIALAAVQPVGGLRAIGRCGAPGPIPAVALRSPALEPHVAGDQKPEPFASLVDDALREQLRQ